ncbi:hypothetical protein [Lysinibacillus piscis]|uniref:Uncharacterized protein n=1 Tax=Lysinibacillus piscis TaxID=2518931 RepID=A0ABQ5NKG4_9BACI|nr:hypothetical protein [Lysinibacillus sp. KH24]GLC88843.1 hypothetical protein LYSBPC_19700 [Lysinibacillus sp. KH24]
MFTIHFYEHKTVVLSQLLTHIPCIETNIQLKGRKAKVNHVQQINEQTYHVYVLFEKIPPKPPIKDLGKKKR